VSGTEPELREELIIAMMSGAMPGRQSLVRWYSGGASHSCWEYFLIRCEVLGQGCLCVQIVKASEANL